MVRWLKLNVVTLGLSGVRNNMPRLTTKYADSNKYYSANTFAEIVQKLGKLEDKEEKVAPELVIGTTELVAKLICPICKVRVHAGDKYCRECGQRLGKYER